MNENLLTDKIDNDGNVQSGKTVDSWILIGYYKSASDCKKFTGTFDGQGHTISGLYFNDSNQTCVGLFGYIGNNGFVKNVGVKDSFLKGKKLIGGVCGDNEGALSNCYSIANVSGTYDIGGICGYNNGTINNCYNTGNISGAENDVGGVCGQNSSAKISNCYNTGNVSGKSLVGEICGLNNIATDIPIIENCYYLQKTGGSLNGVGWNGSGTVTNVEEKTAEEFASGEVAWLLNGSTSEGDLAWRQKVTVISDEDESRKQPYPVLGGDKVFYSNNNYHNHYAYCNECRGEPTQNSEGYYEISNAQELYWFAKHVNTDKNQTANAILTEDIVLYKNLLDADGNPNSNATQNWKPIGYSKSYYDTNIFCGSFDGKGHTISGLYFNESSTEYGGLFGFIEKDENNIATIRNVGVKDSYFKGKRYVGGVCGKNNGGTMENCHNASTVTGTGFSIGGVCGENKENGTITNSYNEGTINGKEEVGGVCGRNYDGIIEICYNTGTVTSQSFVGGVCGWNGKTIKKCYNTGTVTGGTGDVENNYVGGVSGLNTNDGTIENCYNTGAVSAEGSTAYVGGVCGNFDSTSGEILNCYNTGTVSASGSLAWSGGVCGGNSKTRPENCYYLENCATSGNSTNSEGTSKTVAQFASGEVAWLLNGNKLKYDADSDIPTDATSWKWYQKLDNDASPVLKKDEENNTVYAAKKKCDTGDICGWANTKTESLALKHNFGETITLSGKADENTQNLHSYIQTCTTPDCGATKVADENKKVIKGLNVDDDQIEITRENENAAWKTIAQITLGDAPENNWYHAPVEFMANGVSYTRQISDGYSWATVCLPYEISVSNYTDKCKFYELSGVDESKITLTEITETATIAAGTPVFVKVNEGVIEITFSATGETKMLTAPTTGSTAGDYTLTGAFELTTLPQSSGDLFLKNDKMWDVSQVADKEMKVKIFRAYLKNNGSVSGAPQRSIAVDGEATAISDALDTLNDTNAEYYDMSGRRINSLQKGVNIIRSGNKTRKVIIK